MLDELPRSLWVRGWLNRNRDKIITIAFWLIGIAAIASYYPIRNYLIMEEWRVVVYASNLTVPLLVLVSLVGWLLGRAIDRKWLKGRSWLLRQLAWLGCIAIVFLYLDFMGIKMRW